MFDQYYGFSGRPFQLTPDPNFYFESITHRKALSYLGYGMAQGEGFIVITGEIGSGKSTMVAHLMRKVDPEQMTVGQVVTSNLDGSELVHLVAQSFGLDVAGQDKANPLATILSVGMMFRYSFDLTEADELIQKAVVQTIETHRTGDIMSEGKTLVGCQQMGDLVLKALESL